MKKSQNFTLETMAAHPNRVSLHHSLSLMDNLDEGVELPDAVRNSYLNVPFRQVAVSNLLFCTAGTIGFRIGLQDYTLRADNALFLGSERVCELTAMPADVRFFSVSLNEDIFRPNLSSLIIGIVQRSFARDPVCRFTPDVMEQCVSVYRQMKSALQAEVQQPLTDELLKALAHVLQVMLCSVYVLQEEDRENDWKVDRKQSLFNRFMELVRTDYTREHNIKYYADRLSVTPRYLSQVSYQQSGHYASNHIDQLLISEAKQLIRSGQQNILQVSQMLGFNNISTFGRFFKKFTGYSPTQYREITNH